jgi:hypothetical protein
MNNLTLANNILLRVLEKGYNISLDGTLYRNGKKINSTIDNKGYKKLSFRCKESISFPVPLHRLQAYLKFGEQIFDKTLVVRHLDGNSLNNSWENIGIGTNKDNQLDRPQNELLKYSLNATRIRQNSIREINERFLIYKDLYNGLSYNEIIKKYDNLSKGTLSYMKNKSLEYKEFCSIQ